MVSRTTTSWGSRTSRNSSGMNGSRARGTQNLRRIRKKTRRAILISNNPSGASVLPTCVFFYWNTDFYFPPFALDLSDIAFERKQGRIKGGEQSDDFPKDMSTFD